MAKMSQNTQPTRELRLIRIKSWFIPADTNSYQTLRGLKIPLLKVHRDFIPTLFLATKKAKIKPISLSFTDTLNAYLDKVGASWKAQPGRNCRLTESRLTFTAPLTKRNRESVARLDIALAKFFERWAHHYTPTYSTSGDRLKLVVDFGFDPRRDPVIRAAPEPEVKAHELELGFTKIRISFHENGVSKRKASPPMIQTEVLVKAGTAWTLAHTTTCLASEVGDLNQFMTALALLHGKRMVENP